MKRRIISLLLVALMLLGFSLPAAAKMNNVSMSEKGYAFTKKKEGFSATNDGGYIGYSTVISAADQAKYYPNGVITKENADLLLREFFARTINQRLLRFIKDGPMTFTQNQVDALLDLTYTTGGWMTTTYSLGRIILGQQKFTEIEFVNSIGSWCHGSGSVFLKGLAVRRMQEAAIFLHGDYEDGSSSSHYCFLHFVRDGSYEVEEDIHYYFRNGTVDWLPYPTKEGYGFLGWFTAAGKEIKVGDKITSDTYLYPKWGETNQAIENKSGDYKDNSGSETYSDIDALNARKAAFSNYPDAIQFTDLNTTDTYFDLLCRLSSMKLINGYPDGTFKATSAATAGEFLKLLVLASGSAVQSPSGNHWASGYLSFAENHDWIAAGQITNLDQPVTRQTVAMLMVKALKIPKVYTASPYTDSDDPYVKSVYRYGLMQGTKASDGKTYFYPNNSLSRWELCDILYGMMHADLRENYFGYHGSWYLKLDSVPKNTLDQEGFIKQSNGSLKYKNGDVSLQWGLDISDYQKTVDFQQLKAAGIQFVIIRVGYQGTTEGQQYEDATYITNIQNAKAAGLKVGAYMNSTAINEAEAEANVQFALQCLQKTAAYDSGTGTYLLDLPLYFDWEVNNDWERHNGTSKAMLTSMIKIFCNGVTNAGLKAGYYLNVNQAYGQVDLSQLTGWSFWLANYCDYYDFGYFHDVWQYNIKNTVPGISGKVDMNVIITKN